MTQSRSKRAKADRGFTLVEVVVALGILSTAAIGFSTLSRGSVDGAKQIELRYLARTVADNELTRVFTERAPLRIGVTDGQAQQMGRNFTWIRTVAPAAQDGLVLVQLQVSEADTGTVLVEASTLKGEGG